MAKLKEGTYIASYGNLSGCSVSINIHSLIFEVAPNPSGHLRVWFSWLDTTHCVDNGKTCKVLARINDIVGVDYDVVVRITGLEVQQ